MNVTSYIDSISYTKKPIDSEIGKISNRICKASNNTDLESLFNSVNNGKTIVPFIFRGNQRSKDTFYKTNLILLDFDNPNKVSSALDDCLNLGFTKNNASFYYESFNSTSEVPKFRLVFVLDYFISSSEKFKETYNYLLKIYPEADSACNDCARLFFGGKKAKEINFRNTLSEDTFPKFKVKNEVIDFDNYSSDCDAELLSAYRSLDGEYIRNHYKFLNIPLFNKEYNTDAEFLKEFAKLNMYSLFNLPKTTFKCILFEESKPSCSIFLNEKEDYIYIRFSMKNKINKNNFQLMKELANISYNDTILFLIEVLGIKIHARIKKDKFMEKLNNNLNSTNEEFKYLHKLINRHKSTIKDILHVMFHAPYVKNEKLEFISFASVYKLAEYVYGADKTDAVKLDTKRKKISQILLTLTYLGIITNLNDEEILNIDEKIISSLNYKKKLYRQNNRSNVYRLNMEISFEEVELMSKKLLDNKITISKVNSNSLILIEDSEKYKEINVQSTKEKINPKLEKLKIDLSEYIRRLFEGDSSYINVEDIKLYLKYKGFSQKIIKENLYLILTYLQDTFNYTIERSSSKLELKLGVKLKKNCTLILFN